MWTDLLETGADKRDPSATAYPMDDDRWLADLLELQELLETGELRFTRTVDKRDPSATASNPCPSPTTSSLNSILMFDPMDDDRHWLTLRGH